MGILRAFAGKHSDVLLVLLVLGILVVLFVPIPTPLLDFLILMNFSFAFLILLLTFYMQRPVEFSTFPPLLLIATLFRLSLNVAATRLILSDGDAGQVISAIGSYVVGGNYVIGLIVFLILIVVQYVVVTNGAQRVSEVAARFTLDSMPGQQMSIDADLNMGLIDQAEAQKRRKNLEKEAAFYGAMDGASKFVKGDAIAGILILLVNIIGGLTIGVLQQGMPWGQALQTYSLLTIGDGIVTQVPALVIAVGTGIIITRSASDGNLSNQVMRQITSFPKTLVLVAGVLGLVVLLPGIPVLPTLTLCAAVLLVAVWVMRYPPTSKATDSPEDHEATTSKESDPYEQLAIFPVELTVGNTLANAVGAQDSLLASRVAAFRQQFAQEIGLILPEVRIRQVTKLAPTSYEISIHGVTAGRGEVHLDKSLAIHPSGDTRSVRGLVTRDPTYGLPAVWIEEAQREEAKAARYTLVDSLTVIVTHITETLRRESANLLTRIEAERLVNRVRKSQPGLVEEIVPTVLALGDIQKVLQLLLRERVSIRHIDAIIETLAEAARVNKDPYTLAEAVRQRMGAAICSSLIGEGSHLEVLTLEPELEGNLVETLRRYEGRDLVLEPKLAEQLIAKLVHNAEAMLKKNLLPVLLCSPDLRRHLRSLCERAIPHLRVLAVTEVPPTVQLKSFASVSLKLQPT